MTDLTDSEKELLAIMRRADFPLKLWDLFPNRPIREVQRAWRTLIKGGPISCGKCGSDDALVQCAECFGWFCLFCVEDDVSGCKAHEGNEGR